MKKLKSQFEQMEKQERELKAKLSEMREAYLNSFIALCELHQSHEKFQRGVETVRASLPQGDRAVIGKLLPARASDFSIPIEVLQKTVKESLNMHIGL